MKKILLPLLAMTFVSAGFSQFFDKNTGKNVMKVIGSPVIVHNTQSKTFNERMKNAFTEFWKVSPFQMYEGSAAKPIAEGETYAAFMPAIVGLTVRGHETSMNNPFFIYGEAGASGNVRGEGIIGVFPINGFHYEFDPKATNYYDRAALRIPYIVYNLNDMLTWLKDKGKDNGFDDYIKAKNARLAKKTLLIPKDLVTEWDVNPATTALMKGRIEAGQKDMKEIKAAVLDEGDITYEGKYKVMTNEEIMKLETGADADKYALFLPAIDNHKYLMAFDLKTKELLYFEKVTMGMRIKSKDFEKMNKAIGF